MPEGPKAYNDGLQLERLLGPDRTTELRSRLTQGQTVKSLAPVVQGEWGFFADKKISTVETMLHRYAREVVKKHAIQRVMATVTKRGHVSVSTLETLSDLCQTQQKRLQRALSVEAKMNGLLNDGTTAQIKLLADMLSKLAYLQLETGLLPRAAKTVKGVMMGEDGKPVQFGWVENDDSLLERLGQEIDGRAEPAY